MADEPKQTDAAKIAVSDDAESRKLYLDYLIKKHADTIEDVLNLPIDKQKEVFRSYGVDPNMLMERYPNLMKKNEDLKLQNINLSKTAKNIGGIGFASVLAALLVTPRRFFNNSVLLKGFFTVFGSGAAGVLAYMIPTYALTFRNRQESQALSTEARDEMKRNLAVMFELVERGQLAPVAPPSGQEMPDKSGTFASRMATAKSLQPSQSHTERVKNSETTSTPAL